MTAPKGLKHLVGLIFPRKMLRRQVELSSQLRVDPTAAALGVEH
jgi:hypothetical protein